MRLNVLFIDRPMIVRRLLPALLAAVALLTNPQVVSAQQVLR